MFGPTGVGKTALLNKLFVDLAEVVSADALQVYRGLDIGTAKPDADVLSRIPHHLIDILEYTEPFNVGEFRRMADLCVSDILSRGKIPIVSGGTAYYLRGWLMGVPNTPQSDPTVREALERKWCDAGNDALREALKQVDPISAERIGIRDRYRMLRAMEVFEQTGRPLSDFPVPDVPRDDYEVLLLGLKRDRADLNRRIEERVDEMFRKGLAQEVAALRADGARLEHPGMKAIGYREWFPTDGVSNPSEEDVRELIVRNTRRYAKRQMTFFASLPDVRWFDVDADIIDAKGIAELISKFLGIDALPALS